MIEPDEYVESNEYISENDFELLSLLPEPANEWFEDQSSELYDEGEYEIERSFSSNDSSNDMVSKLNSSTTSSLDYSVLEPYVNVTDLSPKKKFNYRTIKRN